SNKAKATAHFRQELTRSLVLKPLFLEVIAMTILTESILIESKSARESQLSEISDHRAQEILLKVKSLYLALWQGTGIITTEQLAEFFEIETPATLRQVLNRHQEEFEADGVRTLRGKALKDVRDILSLTSTQANLTIWTPRAALRLGMLLQNSEIAKAVRTTLLNAVEKVIPAQAQENEHLKLELELIKAKQHYQDSAQAILTTNSPAMLAYLRGDAPPPVQVECRERFVDPVTRREIGSQSGRSLSQLIADVGLNPKSTRARNRVKRILKCYLGLDYDSGRGWTSASYLREFKVLSDEVYDQALKVVLAELVTTDDQPNLFVYQFQQASLSPANEPPQLGF
ncbi:MAG: hypothetical protein ACRDEA_03035, partial [Microcystaceae cyanobacterium]